MDPRSPREHRGSSGPRLARAWPARGSPACRIPTGMTGVSHRALRDISRHERIPPPPKEQTVATSTRLEHDFLGERDVPDDALLRRADAARAWRTSPSPASPSARLSGRSSTPSATVKKAAALANRELGRARRRQGRRRSPQACDEIIAGRASRPVRRRRDPGRRRHLDQHERQRGHRQPRARAARATRKGEYDFLHPNDHVNCGAVAPTTSIPTARQARAALARIDDCSRRCATLRGAFLAKGEEFADVAQDGPHAAAGRRADDARPGVPRLRGRRSARTIARLARGAGSSSTRSTWARTAIGTGLNAPPGYARAVRATPRRDHRHSSS